MPNYQNGKIYKLVSNISNDIYIGSTVNKLSHRLHSHKKETNDCVSKQLFANDAVIQIILIESCPCNNKMELIAREHHYITTLVCINKKIPFITDIAIVNGNHKEWQKAYNKLHAVEILDKQKDYNVLHADEIAVKRKVYYKLHAAEIKAKTELRADEKAATQKVYYELHKDEIAAKKKVYRELHAVEIAAKQRVRYLKRKYIAQQLISDVSTLNQTLEV